VTDDLIQLTARASELAKRHHDLLDDIRYRERDLELEQAELKSLAGDTDPEVLKGLGAQIIVVETITRVLEAERLELEQLEAEMRSLEAELRQHAPTSKDAGPGSSE